MKGQILARTRSHFMIFGCTCAVWVHDLHLGTRYSKQHVMAFWPPSSEVRKSDVLCGNQQYEPLVNAIMVFMNTMLTNRPIRHTYEVINKL